MIVVMSSTRPLQLQAMSGMYIMVVYFCFIMVAFMRSAQGRTKLVFHSISDGVIVNAETKRGSRKVFTKLETGIPQLNMP